MDEITNKVGQISIVPLDKIVYFQENLKEMSINDYKKLQKSILENGIISPGFVWRNKGKIFALDCHQRLKTLKQMRLDGLPVPDKIPVVEIKAKNKKEAKRFLLQYVSQHGKVTEDGLYEFIHNAGLDSDIEDLKLEVSIEGLDFDKFADGFFEEEKEQEEHPDTDQAGSNAEENNEKFTFIVCKKDAEIIHNALAKAERKAKTSEGGKLLLEICRKYLKGK